MMRTPPAVAALALVVALATGATGPTPPPEIYHVITRPLCAELHDRIAPAIGMMLQNDTTIKKSPDIFKQYNKAALYGNDAGSAKGNMSAEQTAGGAANGTLTDSQNMALLAMENLIRPIANNIITIQTTLDNPALMNGTGLPDDDKRLKDIREKLLKALASQNAALDIISGFVDTQQMADLQHTGEEYIGDMSQPDVRTEATPAPDPLTYDPNYAGLPPNPYNINLASIPGLTLGYNPVTRLIDALDWTIDQTATRENDAAKAVMSSAAICSKAVPLAAPSPKAPSP
jgi:hypothetical protein